MHNKLVEVQNLKKYFSIKGKGILHAVDNVTFSINSGETLGLVGESGCGKTTVGRILVGLLPPTSGKIFFEGRDVTSLKKSELKVFRRNVQMIFQDPYTSLNPRKTVKQILSEPYLVQRIARGKELESKVEELIEITRITPDLLNKYPHELDGGKRQTVGIARALALQPKFIVCDEPVSSLDVSIQAQIINLMMDLQEKLELTYLFISHDLSVVKHISRRIAVMYLGEIVEFADTDELFENPMHPYTQALLSAVPIPKVGLRKKRIILAGDVPSPINPKPGCRFAPRCWKAHPECQENEPVLEDKGNNHLVSCHMVSSMTNYNCT
ncbi:ABC transporter ATP-binding protein [Neomoorella humiferrea]|uniref:ABC transporter ATP-binding protein n=1 Tax=Neomoorella humiferrea TaxID=676965 RepID=UPI003D8EA527